MADWSRGLFAHRLGNYAAPSAPRSGPPAATLVGGLRPGSLRVHAPCKGDGHGSRLGFPGRRLPRVPAAPGMSLGACRCWCQPGGGTPAEAGQLSAASGGTPLLILGDIGRWTYGPTADSWLPIVIRGE
jgi:hypothetical protein